MFGGSDDAVAHADIKCLITYKYLKVENTEEVVLKETNENEVIEAVHAWCDNHCYEYVSHQVIYANGARYRF